MLFTYKVFVVAFFSMSVSSTVMNGSLSVQPSFEDMQHTVQAPAGTTAELSCPVRHLGTRQIAWFKGGDILTIGEFVWARNERLDVSYGERTDAASPITTSTLTITDVIASDGGSYYCKITANRPYRSPSIELVVEEPILTVQMTGREFVELNNTIFLNCQMPRGVDGPLSWYKDRANIITTDNSGTIISQLVADNNSGASSSLTINQADVSDSGTYVCVGTLGEDFVVGSTAVHVLVTDQNNIKRGHEYGS